MISAGYIIHHQTLTNGDKKYKAIISLIINDMTLKLNLDCNLLCHQFCARRQHVCGNIDTFFFFFKETRTEAMKETKPWHTTAMFHNISKHLYNAEDS